MVVALLRDIYWVGCLVSLVMMHKPDIRFKLPYLSKTSSFRSQFETCLAMSERKRQPLGVR